MRILTGIVLLLLVVAVANLCGWAVHTSTSTDEEHLRYCSAFAAVTATPMGLQKLLVNGRDDHILPCYTGTVTQTKCGT